MKVLLLTSKDTDKCIKVILLSWSSLKMRSLLHGKGIQGMCEIYFLLLKEIYKYSGTEIYHASVTRPMYA